MRLHLGNNLATLTRDGNVITFHRDYKGDESSRITHVFDDREDDPNKVHKTDSWTVARQVYWSCLGRSGNSRDLADLIEQLRPVLDPDDDRETVAPGDEHYYKPPGAVDR